MAIGGSVEVVRSDFYVESDVLYNSGFGWVVWDFEWNFSIMSGTIEEFVNMTVKSISVTNSSRLKSLG